MTSAAEHPDGSAAPAAGADAAAAQRQEGIVFIGPICAGKSTGARLLAERLGLPYAGLDAVAWSLYAEHGWTRERLREAVGTHGLREAVRQWGPALASAAERFLREHADAVVDLDAGHTHFEDGALFERVRQALAPYRHVVLLLPSEDPDESVRVLRERTIATRRASADSWVIGGYDFIERWVKDPHNRVLATLVVHTQGRTPEETADDILRQLELDAAGADQRSGDEACA